MLRQVADRPAGTTRHRERRIGRTDKVRQQRRLAYELVFHAFAAPDASPLPSAARPKPPG
jgi:hypothetical protein